MKLPKLKRWLSVRDAADHLTKILSEPVSETDLLEFALQRQLVLSAVFVNSHLAVPYERIDKAEIGLEKVPSINEGFVPMGKHEDVFMTGDGQYLRCQCERGKEQVLKNDFPYDLMMIGKETARVREMYWASIGKEVEVQDDTDCCFVGSGQEVFQLGELVQDGFLPAAELPVESVIVVTPDALQTFEKFIGARGGDDRPQSTRQRDNMLRLIAAMAIDKYGYDPKANKSLAPGHISEAASDLGFSITPETVRSYLQQGAQDLEPKHHR
jgi:hypothetical protein